MAKLGKWATGLGKSVKNAPKPYGMSNKGYEARQAAPKFKQGGMSSDGKTATGKPVLYDKK